MLKLIALGAALLGMHGAPHHRYWHMAVENCTISTAVYRNGALRGTPYIQCVGVQSHWGDTPQMLNPADDVYAPPDLSHGTQPCDYEDVPC